MLLTGFFFFSQTANAASYLVLLSQRNGEEMNQTCSNDKICRIKLLLNSGQKEDRDVITAEIEFVDKIACVLFKETAIFFMPRNRVSPGANC
jgi:hypothetical protein